MTGSSRKIEELGKELHQRMIGRDPIAFAEIAESYLPLVTDKLAKRYPTLYDPDLINTAVVDAFYSYLDKPERYRPEKGSLVNYLLISAEGDLRNLLARDKNKNYIPLDEDVELSEVNGEYIVETAILNSEDNVEELVIAKTSLVWGLIKEHLPDLRDQEICKLLMENIRETEEFSKILGLQDLSIEEQRVIVKRHKDRIKKTLLRNIPRDQLGGSYE
jgi:hypothetical protein